ncbi:MAG: glycerophosphodiester phosphodiesterase [Proteobacteria bacterium]|nr:glycerophosphodiester phosphodiesterase [Pseudomonadota bacterium]
MHRYATLLIAASASLSAGAGDVVAPRPDPRPVALVAGLEDGPLKRRLSACIDDPVRRTSFSLGHRGAPLHFPEHTRESYVAAAAMGAGVIECDVTFTRDKQLVCRHAQDDLHTTTDILLTPLAARCVQPFRPAQLDPQGALLAPAGALCRTSDITLAEFRTLRGKRDGFDANARTVEEYVWGGKAAFDALGPSTGTLMSHADSIALFRQLGVQMVPELKQPVVAMPYDGMSQQQFAQRLIDDYKTAGVPPRAVWPQSFNLPDILYLEDAESSGQLPDAAGFERLHAQGVRIWAPPLFALLALDDHGVIVPSSSARDARGAGLELVTWSLERSGPLAAGRNGWYYQTVDTALRGDSDVLQVLDVLARQAQVRAVFSDWPATTTFYANCTGLD